MGSAYARDSFLDVLNQVRARYRFDVIGYVVMPSTFTWPHSEATPLFLAVIRKQIFRFWAELRNERVSSEISSVFHPDIGINKPDHTNISLDSAKGRRPASHSGIIRKNLCSSALRYAARRPSAERLFGFSPTQGSANNAPPWATIRRAGYIAALGRRSSWVAQPQQSNGARG